MNDTETVTDWDESPDTPSSEPAAPVSAPVELTPSAEPGPSDRPADSGDEPEPEPELSTDRDERGRFLKRGRRAKDQASPEDVPRIRELTKNWRQAEAKIRELEARLPQPQTPAEPVYQVPKVPTPEFNEPEPQLEQFADKDDPYGAWQRALARWDRRKEDHEQVRTHQQAHVEQLSRQQQDYFKTAVVQHQQRLMGLIQSNPQAAQMFAQAKAQNEPPPVLDWAIVLDNDSANVALFLASHPDVLDELVLRTVALPVTQQTVATTQRLLRQKMTAVGSGAVVPSQPVSPAPRPPTPLRTAPMRTGEPIPGDDDSVQSHEAYFHRNAKNYRRR